MFTVSVPAANTAFTTLDAVKTELGIEDKASDLWLIKQIDSVSATACQVLGVAQAEDGSRTLGRETLVETMDRRSCWPWTTALRPIIASREHDAKLVLSRRPIVSITSITEDGVAVDAADFEVAKSEGTIKRLDNLFPCAWPASLIVVTYVAGWLMPADDNRNLPEDWENAVISTVKAAWFARNRDPNIKSENIPGVRQIDYFFGTPGQDSPLSPDAMAKLRLGRDFSI